MTGTHITHMAREIEEMPEAAERLAGPEARAQSRLVASDLKALVPPTLITVARGSSDHAATYLNYAAQMTLRIPVASIGPSITSIYGARLKAHGLAALAISQSGKSEDILALCRALKSEGGYVVALTNTASSPLAQATSAVIDIAAGPERAVAATKSCFNSIVAGLWLLADWADDAGLAEALIRLPDCMRALGCADAFAPLSDAITSRRRAVILGRGPGLGIAHEMALKLIETSGIHASSYSGAEVLHGPSAMLIDGYPVLALTTGTGDAMSVSIERLKGQGAILVEVTADVSTGHPLVDPLLDMAPVYRGLERLARSLGADPDNPKHLNKETHTL